MRKCHLSQSEHDCSCGKLRGKPSLCDGGEHNPGYHHSAGNRLSGYTFHPGKTDCDKLCRPDFKPRGKAAVFPRIHHRTAHGSDSSVAPSAFRNSNRPGGRSPSRRVRGYSRHKEMARNRQLPFLRTGKDVRSCNSFGGDGNNRRNNQGFVHKGCSDCGAELGSNVFT